LRFVSYRFAFLFLVFLMFLVFYQTVAEFDIFIFPDF
jgi:hypothetical protein